MSARAPATGPGTRTAKTNETGITSRRALGAGNETGITSRGALGAGTAMFLMGTLPAVSLVLHEYPVYGGQAVRYAGAAVLLLAFMRARGLAHLRLDARELGLLAALAAT